MAAASHPPLRVERLLVSLALPKLTQQHRRDGLEYFSQHVTHPLLLSSSRPCRTKTEELLSLVRIEILEEMNSPRQNLSDRGFSTKI